jgi:hypothetical protein
MAGAVTRVQVCNHCGNVASVMDTMCQACRQRDGLVRRFQCNQCARILDEPRCDICAHDTGIQVTSLVGPRPASDEPLAISEIAQKPDLPPMVYGAVGGAFLGLGLGFGMAFFLDLHLVLGSLLGLTVGTIGGMLLSTKSP